MSSLVRWRRASECKRLNAHECCAFNTGGLATRGFPERCPRGRDARWTHASARGSCAGRAPPAATFATPILQQPAQSGRVATDGLVREPRLPVAACCLNSNKEALSPCQRFRSCRACRVLALGAVGLPNCAGKQSWLDSAGEGAEAVSTLFGIVVPAAALIWTIVVGLALYAGALRPGTYSKRRASQMIIWGGIVAPTLTIFVLMVSSLVLLKEMTAGSPDLTLHARGEQWWWRISHEGPDGEPVPTPNELRLPSGRKAEIVLTAERVIHSFWAPSLGGQDGHDPGAGEPHDADADRAGDLSRAMRRVLRRGTP